MSSSSYHPVPQKAFRLTVSLWGIIILRDIFASHRAALEAASPFWVPGARIIVREV